MTDPPVRHRRDVLVADIHLAGRCREESVEHADECGLTGSGKPHDDEDLALVHVERGVDHCWCRARSVDLAAMSPIIELPHRFSRAAPEHLVELFCSDSYQLSPLSRSCTADVSQHQPAVG